MNVCTPVHFSIYFSVGNEKEKLDLYKGIVLASRGFLCLYFLSEFYFVTNIITRQ